jgi:hypothetical protein
MIDLLKCGTFLILALCLSLHINGQVIARTYDSSRIAIIQLDKRYTWIFSDASKSAALDASEMIQIDSMITVAVKTFNTSLAADKKGFSIDLKKTNFKKQYIAFYNKNGEKEVWINALCDIDLDNRWRHEIIQAEDGGNCYFNFKLNLSTNQSYNFRINSLG